MRIQFTKSKLAEAVDVKVATINAWLRDGLPTYDSETSGRGGKRRMFDAVDVANWLMTTGKHKYLLKLGEFLPETEPPTGEPQDPDALTFLEMADQIVRDAWQRYMIAGNEQKPYMQEQFEKAIDMRRRVRKDHARSEQTLGNVIAISEHERQMYESHGIVAQRLRGLAKKVAPLVANKGAREVYSILREEVDACQRGIAAIKGDPDE